MDTAKKSSQKLTLSLLFIATFIYIVYIYLRKPTDAHTYRAVPKPRAPPDECPLRISERTITPLNNTKHLLVSAFMDQRVTGLDIRIIGIFKRDSIQPLYCLFCCAGQLWRTTPPATILQHSDHFGFPYTTTDVMCQIPENCNASHVTLLTESRGRVLNQIWLPIRNQKSNGKGERRFQFNLTVCISCMFGDYNNVLQVAQTLEIYRLLGVGRVVIYNTSCGSDLNRLLQSYSREGFVEMVPWNIKQHLKPSSGWSFSASGGDVHYFGQLTALNECIYRSMERSRYVLLNDIDEIIMPYRYNDLMSLMDALQQQHPDAGMFHIDSHVFPVRPFNESKWGLLPQWKGVPGFNLLQRIYRMDPDKNVFHPRKMIVQPRTVEQTSVHEILKMFGTTYMVPPDVCLIIHSPTTPQRKPPPDEIHLDRRLWDFAGKLRPSVSMVLRRAGLLTSHSSDAR